MSSQKTNFAVYSGIQKRESKFRPVNILDIKQKNKKEEARQKRIKFIYLAGSFVLITILTILILL
tara:strand:+ start:474 stop:668 length:195 start_codon:yes stop_codon:yes gene_type:complete